PRKVAECCYPAPPVVAFSPAGDVVQAWGGPKVTREWPESNHGVVVDSKNFVWIGGNGGPDSHILKFTRDGKFVAEYGQPGAPNTRASPATATRPAGATFTANSKDPESFGRVAKIFLDPKANEGYVAEGYLNHRVAVIDLDNGKIKRFWGAYGEPPTDENLGPYDPAAPLPRQFGNPTHCCVL